MHAWVHTEKPVGLFFSGSGRLPLAVACFPEPLERHFSAVQADLEKTVLLFKTTFDPRLRKKLLRELRLLLEEADHLSAK